MSWDKFVDQEFESLPNSGAHIAETFMFRREPGGKYATHGSKSGKNVYNVKDCKLVHVTWGHKVSAHLNGNQFMWSHGYFSRPIRPPEPPKPAKWLPFLDKTLESYKNGQPSKIAETFVFRREGAEQFSTNGTKSGKNVYNLRGERMVHVHHAVHCDLVGGEFKWSHGY